MDRERAMQRLNVLTLAAFLLGLGAFIYDSATPRSVSFASETAIRDAAAAAGTLTLFDNAAINLD